MSEPAFFGEPEVTQYAPLKLAGFERIELNPGQTETVHIHLGNLELSYWSTPARRWILAAGPRAVYDAAASDDIRLQGTASIGR
ncbi:MAG: fibronectin type III-like domain-contianing protein [Verrucomicrobia bacterium]|nr:fibronectin type III-like domain-contianing protein [Verrucomicrobiota bacterium]